MGKRMSPARPSVAGLCEAASLRCRMSSDPGADDGTAADDDAAILCLVVLQAQSS